MTTKASPRSSARHVPVITTVSAAVEDGFSALDELREECGEIVNNATGGLAETQRVQTFGETESSLQDAGSPPGVPEALAELEVTYTEDRRRSRSTSRATRCAEACAVLEAVVSALDDFEAAMPEKDKRSEAQQELAGELEGLRNQVQDMIGSAEVCEFPGMYG